MGEACGCDGKQEGRPGSGNKEINECGPGNGDKNTKYGTDNADKENCKLGPDNAEIGINECGPKIMDDRSNKCCPGNGGKNIKCGPGNGEKNIKCVPEITEKVKVASTTLSLCDKIGAVRVRLGAGRMDYTVEPGVYAVGSPVADSPVLVSANYKLTFDTLRKNLAGLDCWLLILDTKGVNVWCSAGKGTFGTEELIHRIEAAGLDEIVSDKTLILPQLGASGVSAHEVTRRTGFSIVYGPVRASDIKDFIAAGNIATKEMRTVNFTFKDRVVLIPMELGPALKKAMPVLGVLLLLNKFIEKPFEKHDIAAYAGAVAAGAALTPALLPYIPGKAFSLKGALVGLGLAATHIGLAGRHKKGNRLLAAGELLLLPAVSSFMAMNFTGASTYTSPSGVVKEMKRALPFIVGAAAIGGAITLGARLFGGKESG